MLEQFVLASAVMIEPFDCSHAASKYYPVEIFTTDLYQTRVSSYT